MLTLEKFKQASEIVKEVTLPTKLVYSEYLSNQTGAEVYLKPENMQYTGAYKVRGAYYKISTMSEENRKKGLVTASAGNHAQGVAYAAKKFGCKATVVMPTVTPLIKVNRTKSYGAEVVLHGDVEYVVPKTKSRERRTARQKESGSTALERGTVLVGKGKTGIRSLGAGRRI